MCSPPLLRPRPSYLFINYPSLSMRVFRSLSEWSGCNCFSLEQLEAAQRDRIETTFAFKMSCDGEEGGSTALLPCPEHHHLPSLSPSLPSLPSSLIYCPSFHPSLHLIYSHHPPAPPFFRSMAPIALSFQRVPRSTGACSSERGIVHLVLRRTSSFVRASPCISRCVCLCVLVHVPRPKYLVVCVCVCVCGVKGVKEGRL